MSAHMSEGRALEKMRFYDGLASEWDHVMNRYDLARRLEAVFDQLLPESLVGLQLLDAGCGLGYFSQTAESRGAVVTSADIGPRLLNETLKRCPSAKTVCSSLTELGLDSHSFDVVVCTEVIEHTAEPIKAVSELHRVLRPGGLLALTVPNWFWKWSVLVANALHLRPYEGFENWQGYFALRRHVQRLGFIVEDWFGFHLLPFQFRFLQHINRVADPAGHRLGPFMINIAARLRKPLS